MVGADDRIQVWSASLPRRSDELMRRWGVVVGFPAASCTSGPIPPPIGRPGPALLRPTRPPRRGSQAIVNESNGIELVSDYAAMMARVSSARRLDLPARLHRTKTEPRREGCTADRSPSHAIGPNDPARTDEPEGQTCRRPTRNPRTYTATDPESHCRSDHPTRRRCAVCGHPGGITSMFIARKLVKGTLLVAYFGLFALLMVAAADFVIHG